jgi:hypothetical protein
MLRRRSRSRHSVGLRWRAATRAEVAARPMRRKAAGNCGAHRTCVALAVAGGWGYHFECPSFALIDTGFCYYALRSRCKAVASDRLLRNLNPCKCRPGTDDYFSTHQVILRFFFPHFFAALTSVPI